MTDSMRDRLLEACAPGYIAPGTDYALLYTADEIQARVLAVLADPNEATVDVVANAIAEAGDLFGWDSKGSVAVVALTALAEHLRGEAS